jgi:hypothetical protein
MAAQKPNLAQLSSKLATTAATPRKAEPSANVVRAAKPRGVPITFHMPEEVREQLKHLAIERKNTVHNLGAEAFNDLFSKYGKPEIAPITDKHRKRDPETVKASPVE